MTAEDGELIETLLEATRIAVVGCSSSPGKAAHDVPAYLREQGYTVVPVNPTTEEIFGVKAYETLADVPGAVDLVDVFRPDEELAGIVEEALERPESPAIWTQLGIRDDEAARRARRAGHDVVQDRCLKVEHQRRT